MHWQLAYKTRNATHGTFHFHGAKLFTQTTYNIQCDITRSRDLEHWVGGGWWFRQILISNFNSIRVYFCFSFKPKSDRVNNTRAVQIQSTSTSPTKSKRRSESIEIWWTNDKMENRLVWLHQWTETHSLNGIVSIFDFQKQKSIPNLCRSTRSQRQWMFHLIEKYIVVCTAGTANIRNKFSLERLLSQRVYYICIFITVSFVPFTPSQHSIRTFLCDALRSNPMYRFDTLFRCCSSVRLNNSVCICRRLNSGRCKVLEWNGMAWNWVRLCVVYWRKLCAKNDRTNSFACKLMKWVYSLLSLSLRYNSLATWIRK